MAFLNVINISDKYTHTGGYMSNKTGFEIRAELLSQAQGLLEMNIERENTKVFTHNDSFPNDLRELGDQHISTEDVIKVARQLGEFVNEK